MQRLGRLNTTIALKIVLLLGFAAFFCLTIFTGSVRLYVHPRIIPFMLFAVATMVIIAILLSRNLFSPEQTGSFWPLLFFVLPLLMALAIPAKPFDSGSGTTGSVQLISNSAAVNTANPDSSAPTSASETPSITADSSQALPQVEMKRPNITLKDGVLVLTSENFYVGLCDVYDNLNSYKGTPISLVGYVFKDSSFGPNQFVPARLLMVCCAADMQPTGLLCFYDGAPQLESNSWVQVDGVIDETSFEGEIIPCIMAKNVTPTEAPAESYVYPY